MSKTHRLKSLEKTVKPLWLCLNFDNYFINFTLINPFYLETNNN